MSTAYPYRYTPGKIPVIISMPHTAAHVPPPLLERFTEPAKKLPDTDWHIEKLYDFVNDLGVHILVPEYSRYVVDLNRGTGAETLYPGQFTTTICPLLMFDGTPIYQPGKEPDAFETGQRIADVWQPYHDKLQTLIDELKEKHKRVSMFDAHSIASQIPMLFDGVLPDLNIGTNSGNSADKTLCDKLVTVARNTPYSIAYNGRFKGGYITRHYGNPAQNVNTVQLELTQHNYMSEAWPFAYDEAKAVKLQSVLRRLVITLIEQTCQ